MRPRPQPHRPARIPGGFTLLEVVFVLAIIGLVMGLAAYSLAEFGRTNAVEEAKAELTFLARQARHQARETGETVWLVLTKERFGLLDRRGEDAMSWTDLRGVRLRVLRAGDTEWREPELYFWEFPPRQLGEPIALRLTGGRGSGADLALQFSPLTGEARPLELLRR
jgi:type II secretion system protein H